MPLKAVLITGATGKQGGAVIDALLKANAPFEILALTRDAQSPSSQRLAKKSPSIKLITGNLDATDAIFNTIKSVTNTPVWGVFSVQAVSKSEESQGKSLIDSALHHRVSHFVYSSADRGGARSATMPTNVPHFRSKHHIEQHLVSKASAAADAENKFTYTILRPVAFFENLSRDFFGKVFTACWAVKVPEDRRLQMVSTRDVGVFGARALMESESRLFKDASLSLAGEALAFGEFEQQFERKTGEKLPMTYAIVARMLCGMSKELGYMFDWFRDVGFGADVEECARVQEGILRFEEWLATESAWKKG